MMIWFLKVSETEIKQNQNRKLFSYKIIMKDSMQVLYACKE